MSVPSLENGPWAFDVNNTYSDASYANVARWAIWQAKEIIAGFSAHWSVVASTDGSTVKQIGDASPDLWVAATDIVDDSWIILENGTTGEQLCFHMTDSNFTAINIYWSATGDYATSGGTTTAPPSVTEVSEIFGWSAGVYFFGSSTYPDSVSVNGMISDDGKCTRIFFRCREVTTYGTQVILLEELLDTPSEWTSTHKRCAYLIDSTEYGTGPIGQGPRLTDMDRQKWDCFLQHATLADAHKEAYPTAECYGTSLSAGTGIPIFNVTTSLGWVTGGIACPIGIIRPNNDYGGALGRIQDMYWAPAGDDSLDTYPSGGSKVWIKFGCLLVPWNGSTPSEAPGP